MSDQEINMSIIMDASNEPSVTDTSVRPFAEDSSILDSEDKLLCIWFYDDNIHKDIIFEMVNRLKELFNYICEFTDSLKFMAYLPGLLVEKIFVIITSEVAQYLYPLVKNRLQHHKVYQLSTRLSLLDLKNSTSHINKLLTEISQDREGHLHERQASVMSEVSETDFRHTIAPPPWSIWNSINTEKSFRYAKQESPEFFLFQMLTRIVTKIPCDYKQAFEEMFQECRSFYLGNTSEVKKIDKMQKTYQTSDPIKNYTKDSFLFRLVGKAFRSENFEQILKFRRYIIDLHQQLEKLIQNQDQFKTQKLYRGKKLSPVNLQQLKDNIGALISMNGFLSTTWSKVVALEIFAGIGQNPNEKQSVLFEFSIDQTTMKRLYAYIASCSQYPQEEEVLFTLGSIWRIESVDKCEDSYWLVQLSSCNENSLLINRLLDEFAVDSSFLMLGDILRQLGKDKQAENFYNKMLKESSLKNETKLMLNFNIAMINLDQEKYSVALNYFQEAAKLKPEKVINKERLVFHPLCTYSIIPSSIRIYNNMGILSQKNGDRQKALKYFKRALDDKRSDRIDKAIVNCHIGLLYFGPGEYSKSEKYFERAVKLAQNHQLSIKFKQYYDAVKKHVTAQNSFSDKKLHDSK